MDFSDRTVIVTGAAGNLGRFLATSFTSAGARLVLVDQDSRKLSAAFRSEDENLLLVDADLLNRLHSQRIVEAALERFGTIDILCNVAGGFCAGEAVHEMSNETWESMFDLNVRTLLNAVHAVVPVMLQQHQGKIVNVASGSASRGAARTGAYVAAKSAVVRLTEAMSEELRSSNINVNCVLPSIIDTPENRQAMPEANTAQWVTPEDVSKAIMFLASADAQAIHGASLPVT